MVTRGAAHDLSKLVMLLPCHLCMFTDLLLQEVLYVLVHSLWSLDHLCCRGLSVSEQVRWYVNCNRAVKVAVMCVIHVESHLIYTLWLCKVTSKSVFSYIIAYPHGMQHNIS